MGDVRTATVDDVPTIGSQLALAFHDDPVTSTLIPPGVRNRHGRLSSFLALGTTGGVRRGEVWTTADHASTAVWKAPGEWKVGGLEALRGTPAMTRVLGLGLLRSLRVLQAIEAKHPTEPHWYLEILGTIPAAQGRGLGAAVMGPVLDRCDDEGIGAYLESSKERNVPYYRRHGFEVTGELPLPGGPTVWLMWRDPR